MERTGGRSTWSIAHLVWFPALAVGLWLLVGADFGTTKVGDGEWTAHLFLAAPEAWFDDAVRGGFGAGLIAVGFVFGGIARWQPDPARLPLTITRYPMFAMASLLFIALGVMSLITLSGHVLDPGTQGFDWRFLLSLRQHPFDVTVGWTSLAVALGLWILSYGPAWHSFRGGRAPATEAYAE